MEGKDAIINSILTTAETSANDLIKQAEEEKSAAIEKCLSEQEQKKLDKINKAKEEARLYIERRISVANLEKNKVVLKAKQKLMDSVYAEAVIKVLNMTDNLYRDFIGELIAKYAENRDEVIIAERDQKRLNEDWLKKLSKSLNLDLNLGDEFHNQSGGIILSSKSCDKNLTLDTIIDELKPSIEQKLIKRLFGN